MSSVEWDGQFTDGSGPISRVIELPVPQSSDAIILILKLDGDQCNIDCLYCFEKRKPQRASRRLDAPTIHGVMKSLGSRPVKVVLQGGEPLLIGKARMASILEAISSYDNVTSVSVMTNGTLIDHEWVELFDQKARPAVEWGVSFDGGGGLSGYRVSYKDTPTVAGTLRGLNTLSQHGRQFGVICVITDLHAGRAVELINSVQPLLGLRNLKLVPCLDYGVDQRPLATPSGSRQNELWNPTNPQWSIEPMEFARLVVEVTSLWVERGLWRSFELEPTMSICRNLLGLPSDFTDYSLYKDAFVVVLYPDGRLTGHDRATVARDLSGHPIIGQKSLEDLLRREMEQQQEAWKPLLARCSRCRYWDSCHGGELFTRLAVRRAGVEDQYCSSRAHMIEEIRPYLRSLMDKNPAGTASAPEAG